MSQVSPTSKSPRGNLSIPTLAEEDYSMHSSSSRAACGIDQLCPASVTTFPKKNIPLEQYLTTKTFEGLLHYRKNKNSHKDHEFDWYDLDNTDREIETNTAVSKKKRGVSEGINFDVFVWTISVHHNFGETEKDREFRESIERLEDESDLTSEHLNSSFSSFASF